MAIIIEGMDATGKSTLAQALAPQLNLSIKESEGPPATPLELANRVDRYQRMTNTLFVRHPCVSHNIYGSIHPQPFTLDIGDFYSQGHTFIYCAPTGKANIPKPYENKDFISSVAAAHHEIERAYNAWAIAHAHIIYRFGDAIDRIAALLAQDMVADIHNFHTQFNIAYDGPPRHLPPDLYEFRQNFLQEEATEYALAPDLAHRFDALIDVVYVALGSSHLHGFNFYEGWRRVHAANMAKVRASCAEDSARQSIHDVVKPRGWLPPDLTDLV